MPRRVLFSTADDVTFVRLLFGSSSFHYLSLLHSALRDIESSANVTIVSVRIIEEKCRPVVERSVYFCNICGRIKHCDVTEVVRDEVLPAVTKLRNEFGHWNAIYSPKCNLVTSTNMSSTLFRGACSSRDVFEVVRHAIQAETILHITLHMIVASARMSHPVAITSKVLEYSMQRDHLWKFRVEVTNAETFFTKSLTLYEFSETFLEIHALSRANAPKSVQVNVTRTGSINMFMSLAGGVEFHKDIENLYMSTFQFIVAMVSDNT